MAGGRSVDPPVAEVALTGYEARQLAAIAAWKAETPGLVRRMIRAIAEPIGEMAGKLLPGKALSSAIAALNTMAGQLARDDNILKDAHLKSLGVASLRDIADQPMEFADSLADWVIDDASRLALGMGAATGAGGPVGAVAGLAVLVAGALRVIYRVSQAYGYDIDHPGDRQLMLHILALSTASGPAERARAMANYQRQIETSFLHQAVEESAQNVLQRAVLGAELGTLIPGFSIVFNAYLNREFVTRSGVTAKRVFQESWLRDRHKVGWIFPSGSKRR